MSKANEQRLPQQYTRPDLRWAEELLGESLGPLPEPARDFTPAGDARVIPRGEYCYDFEANDMVPCPHYCETEYGTVKCSYASYEAYNDDSEFAIQKLLTRFKSLADAQAAGVVADFLFTDSFKVCGTNMQRPGRAPWLKSLIEQYRAEVESQLYVAERTADKPDWDFGPMTDWMISTAQVRFELWQYMTGMVEDIPPELINAVMVADKRFRVKTFPSSELMDPDFAKRMPPHENPKRQYWYLYRKNLGNPDPHELLHDPIGFFPPVRRADK